MIQKPVKPKLLTGDTPTGALHLGHYVGTLENRIQLQHQYDCYFLLANKHCFTTLMHQPKQIRENVLTVAMDWLSVGIDPQKSTLFIQSEVPEIDELTFYFSMLLPFNRVMRNPTLKDEIIAKQLGDTYPFGFPLYAVGQTADILAFCPDIIPVGKDQLPHIEMTREVARKFQTLYLPEEQKEFFGKLEPLLGRVERLVGLGAPGPDGQFLKMSKSLNNAIFLSDTADVVHKKVMSMYTDPARVRVTDPGTTENNPLWIFHDAFNEDATWLSEYKQRYRLGKVSDFEVKKKLVEVLNAFLEPIRSKRKVYEQDPQAVLKILHVGTQKARMVAMHTMKRVKEAIYQNYW